MDVTSSKILERWTEFTLTNENGMIVRFLDYGGIITGIEVPDRGGISENVVLAYRNMEDYIQNPGYFGALIGPVAGRIKNSTFAINGKNYHLKANNGTHLLHGGNHGFHQVIWKAEPFTSDHQVGCKLYYTSDQYVNDFPGCTDVIVTYTLTNDNQFHIDYEAVASEDTILTLTNHTYFNLTGNANKSIHQHYLSMASKYFLSLDKELIPTGEVTNTADTPFDFRHARQLGEGIESSHAQNELVGNGYDHYFLLDPHENQQVVVKEPGSGRVMTVKTTQPGLVLYTANKLDEGLAVTNGFTRRYGGFCLETQASPASLHDKNLPSIYLKANHKYNESTVFTFTCSSS